MTWSFFLRWFDFLPSVQRSSETLTLALYRSERGFSLDPATFWHPRLLNGPQRSNALNYLNASEASGGDVFERHMMKGRVEQSVCRKSRVCAAGPSQHNHVSTNTFRTRLYQARQRFFTGAPPTTSTWPDYLSTSP